MDKKGADKKWSVDYREPAEQQAKEINQGKRVILMTLDSGDYFIADWKGFFRSIEDKKHSYSGYWLQVK